MLSVSKKWSSPKKSGPVWVNSLRERDLLQAEEMLAAKQI
jgi:hypothetical protein